MGRWIAIAAALLLLAAGGLLLFLPGRSQAPTPTGSSASAAPGPASALVPAGESAGPAAAPSAAGEGVTSGILLRSRTRTPVAGTVVVTTRAGRVRTATTGADGVFRVGGLA